MEVGVFEMRARAALIARVPTPRLAALRRLSLCAARVRSLAAASSAQPRTWGGTGVTSHVDSRLWNGLWRARRCTAHGCLHALATPDSLIPTE